jgi:hypothetical protein
MKKSKRLYFTPVKVPAYRGDNPTFADEPEYWYADIFDQQGKDVAQTERCSTKEEAKKAAIAKIQELEAGGAMEVPLPID